MLTYVTHGVAFYTRLCAKNRASPFHFAGVLHRSALALTTRCLCTKNWANPFHLQVFCNLSWSSNDKNMGLSISLWCFTEFALATSTLCLCTKNGIKVVLWITIETTSSEIFILMKITKHWLKVLCQQQVSCSKQLT